MLHNAAALLAVVSGVCAVVDLIWEKPPLLVVAVLLLAISVLVITIG
jgi:hypothetical protein